MNWASFKLSVHESTDDIRPGRDDPGAPGRDSTQPRCTLRSSVTWGFAGGGGYELSPGGRGPWGFAWDGGQLGGSLRKIRFRRVERPRGSRPAVTVGPDRNETSRGGAEEKSLRLWIAGAALGWPAVIELSGETARRRLTRPTMPAAVSSPRISSAQTQTRSCSSEPSNAGDSKKNSNDSPEEMTSNCGRWMKSISSSTAVAARCGSPQRFAIQSAVMRPLAKASATSARCESRTVGLSPPSQRDTLTLKPVGVSCASSAAPLTVGVAKLSSSPTMQGTITRTFISLG